MSPKEVGQELDAIARRSSRPASGWAELAAKQQAWIDEQKRMLRDCMRQRSLTGRAVDQLARVGRDASKQQGWSM